MPEKETPGSVASVKSNLDEEILGNMVRENKKKVLQKEAFMNCSVCKKSVGSLHRIFPGCKDEFGNFYCEKCHNDRRCVCF